MVHLHARQTQVKAAVEDAVGHSLAVALVDGEIDLRVKPPVFRQNFGQDVGRWNGGRSQLDDLILFLRPAAEQTVPQAQNIPGALVQLSAALVKLRYSTTAAKD